MEILLVEVRSTLQHWGAWWRWQEQKGMGHAAVGPGHQLIEFARLGCRVQQSARPNHSDSIRVPAYIAEVDAAVETLPEGQRAALVAYYIRRPGLPRSNVKSRALLRAELRVGQAL